MSDTTQVPSQILKLHMGELTANELRVARAAYALALAHLGQVVPVYMVWQTATVFSDDWQWCEVGKDEYDQAPDDKRRLEHRIPDGIAPAVVAAAAKGAHSLEPTAYYVELVAPGMADDGTKIGPWFRKSEAEVFANEFNVLRPLFGHLQLQASRK